MTLFPRIVELIRKERGDEIVVFGGGIIPDSDIPKLKEAGIAEIFTPGTTTKTIIEWVNANVATNGET